MTNAELLAKIREEIERRKSLLTQHSKLTYDLILETFIKEYDDLLSFLSSLESEKPMDLEDFEKALDNECKRYFNSMTPEQFLNTPNTVIARHFAELSAEHEKEELMKEAVEGIAHPDDCEIWVDLIGYGFNIKDGDKVRVIVLPKKD